MTGHAEHIAELRAELESARARMCPCGVTFEHCTDHDESREDS